MTKTGTTAGGNVLHIGTGHLFTSVAAIIGGIWLVAAFTISGLRDDVGIIRKSLSDLQAAGMGATARIGDVESRALDRVRDAEIKLAEQSLALTKELVTLGGKFDGLGQRLGGLDTSLATLTIRIGALDESMKGLSDQMTTLQKQLASFPNWNDPKVMNEFLERVKSTINDPNYKILIVPFGSVGGPSQRDVPQR